MADEIYKEVREFLEGRPWFQDRSAGERALKLHFMYQAGFEVGMDDPCNFSGEAISGVVAIARSGDRIAHQALSEISEWLTTHHRPVPLALKQYLGERTPKWKRGPHPV